MDSDSNRAERVGPFMIRVVRFSTIDCAVMTFDGWTAVVSATAALGNRT